MDGFSIYFTFEALTDSKSHPQLVIKNRFDSQKYINAGKRLSKLLESIRHILGNKPITVNSGFRNPALNLAVGSKAKSSAHLRFEACDIVPINMSIDDAFYILIKAKEDGLLPDLRKVLQEGSWLHVEVSMGAGDYRGFFVSKDGNNTWEKVA